MIECRSDVNFFWGQRIWCFPSNICERGHVTTYHTEYWLHVKKILAIETWCNNYSRLSEVKNCSLVKKKKKYFALRYTFDTNFKYKGEKKIKAFTNSTKRIKLKSIIIIIIMVCNRAQL